MDTLMDYKQLAIMSNTESPLCIVAGPGSGKTYTLIERIKYTMRQKNNIRIIVFAFSKSAVVEMTSRLLSDNMINDRINVLTLHSYGYKMIMKNYHLLGFTKVPKKCSSKQSMKILLDILHSDMKFKELYDGTDSEKACCRQLLKLFRFAKTKINPIEYIRNYFNTNSSSSSSSSSSAKNSDTYNSSTGEISHRIKLIVEIYDVYHIQLKMNNLIEFDDMVSMASTLLSTYNNTSHIGFNISSSNNNATTSSSCSHGSIDQDRINSDTMSHVPLQKSTYAIVYPIPMENQYLYVDEFQDLNPIQLSLLLHLSASHGRVTVVGDFDQLIYSFQGADKHNFTRFQSFFQQRNKPVNIVSLRVNYRSESPIVTISNIIANQEIPNEMLSKNTNKSQVRTNLLQKANNITNNMSGKNTKGVICDIYDIDTNSINSSRKYDSINTIECNIKDNNSSNSNTTTTTVSTLTMKKQMISYQDITTNNIPSSKLTNNDNNNNNNNNNNSTNNSMIHMSKASIQVVECKPKEEDLYHYIGGSIMTVLFPTTNPSITTTNTTTTSATNTTSTSCCYHSMKDIAILYRQNNTGKAIQSYFNKEFPLLPIQQNHNHNKSMKSEEDVTIEEEQYIELQQYIVSWLTLILHLPSSLSNTGINTTVTTNATTTTTTATTTAASGEGRTLLQKDIHVDELLQICLQNPRELFSTSTTATTINTSSMNGNKRKRSTNKNNQKILSHILEVASSVQTINNQMRGTYNAGSRNLYFQSDKSTSSVSSTKNTLFFILQDMIASPQTYTSYFDRYNDDVIDNDPLNDDNNENHDDIYDIHLSSNKRVKGNKMSHSVPFEAIKSNNRGKSKKKRSYNPLLLSKNKTICHIKETLHLIETSHDYIINNEENLPRIINKLMDHIGIITQEKAHINRQNYYHTTTGANNNNNNNSSSNSCHNKDHQMVQVLQDRHLYGTVHSSKSTTNTITTTNNNHYKCQSQNITPSAPDGSYITSIEQVNSTNTSNNNKLYELCQWMIHEAQSYHHTILSHTTTTTTTTHNQFNTTYTCTSSTPNTPFYKRNHASITTKIPLKTQFSEFLQVIQSSMLSYSSIESKSSIIAESSSSSVSSSSSNNNNISDKDGGIYMGTIHSAKGREWKYVYLIDANDDMYTSFHTRNKNSQNTHFSYDDDDEDEANEDTNASYINHDDSKKLLYVAITRAKSYLTIAYLGQISAQKREISRYLKLLFELKQYSWIQYIKWDKSMSLNSSRNGILINDIIDKNNDTKDKRANKEYWEEDCVYDNSQIIHTNVSTNIPSTVIDYGSKSNSLQSVSAALPDTSSSSSVAAATAITSSSVQSKSSVFQKASTYYRPTHTHTQTYSHTHTQSSSNKNNTLQIDKKHSSIIYTELSSSSQPALSSQTKSTTLTLMNATNTNNKSHHNNSKGLSELNYNEITYHSLKPTSTIIDHSSSSSNSSITLNTTSTTTPFIPTIQKNVTYNLPTIHTTNESPINYVSTHINDKSNANTTLTNTNSISKIHKKNIALLSSLKGIRPISAHYSSISHNDKNKYIEELRENNCISTNTTTSNNNSSNSNHILMPSSKILKTSSSLSTTKKPVIDVDDRYIHIASKDLNEDTTITTTTTRISKTSSPPNTSISDLYSVSNTTTNKNMSSTYYLPSKNNSICTTKDNSNRNQNIISLIDDSDDDDNNDKDDGKRREINSFTQKKGVNGYHNHSSNNHIVQDNNVIITTHSLLNTSKMDHDTLISIGDENHPFQNNSTPNMMNPTPISSSSSHSNSKLIFNTTKNVSGTHMNYCVQNNHTETNIWDF